ncbi:MAG: anti-sigma factor [Anaerolineales bacterium]|nr:anti-sigma factor [Anaerolineales bacterium]
MDANEHVLDLIEAYVLESLDEPETSRVRQHISQCPACQREVRAFQMVLGELVESLPQFSPPASLRTRVLTVVTPPRPKVAHPQPFRSTFWQFLQSLRAPAFVGIGLILVLAFSNILLWRQVNNLRSETTNTDMLTEALHPANASYTGTGLVVMDPHGEYGTIIVDAIPPSPAGYQYQVWLSYDNKIDSGGVFTVPEKGYSAKVIYAPEHLIIYTRVWVTLEPEGGSDQPSGEVVLQTHP